MYLYCKMTGAVSNGCGVGAVPQADDQGHDLPAPLFTFYCKTVLETHKRVILCFDISAGHLSHRGL